VAMEVSGLDGAGMTLGDNLRSQRSNRIAGATWALAMPVRETEGARSSCESQTAFDLAQIREMNSLTLRRGHDAAGHWRAIEGNRHRAAIS
jgi:hypothetical protein